MLLSWWIRAPSAKVRTIQRIEAGQPAATESLKCLAAVFEVDFSTLNAGETMPERQEEEAFRYVRKLRGFYVHLFQYVLVNLWLLAIKLIFMPRRLWVLWVIGGWGIGLLGHAFSVFRPASFLGPEWERQQVEKRLGRPL